MQPLPLPLPLPFPNQQPLPLPYQQPYQQPYQMLNQQAYQQPYQQQYGVQQLYSPPEDQEAQNKKNFSSVVKSVIGLGGPMLLAAAGLYCIIQGKDIQSLFYAGIVLIAIAIVFICISCVWFCKHPPSSDACFNAMMGMSLCTQCCSLAVRLAD